MKAASWITALGITLGVSFLQIACGDAQADGQKKMDTADKAPAQPTKPVKLTDAEWKKKLTDEQYRILRKNGTERAFSKVYDEFKHQGEGTYFCAGCDAELFTSKEKFDARCGWPAFYDASKHKNVKTLRDTTAGMVRIEVRCNVCDGHLGHVFEGEGFNTPTDQRYCINGAVLKFVPNAPAAGEKKDVDSKPEKKVDPKAEKKP